MAQRFAGSLTGLGFQSLDVNNHDPTSEILSIGSQQAFKGHTVTLMIRRIDKIIERSLRRFAKDTLLSTWCAKERDWVNYYAHRYLMEECSRAGPLKEPGQICIEVRIPQPPQYKKLGVCRDLVIWPNVGDTCFTPDWKPGKHPLAVIEWKVHRPRHRNRQVDHEREWLRAYCRWQPSVLAYAIEVDGTCLPTTIVCTRFIGFSENRDWLRLNLRH